MRFYGWIAAFLCLFALVGSLLYRLSCKVEPEATQTPEPERQADVQVADAPLPTGAAPREVLVVIDAGAQGTIEAPLAEPNMPVDAASDADVSPDVAERLAQDIPQELNARLGRCYDETLDVNATWLVTARASFRGGEVAFMDVRVTERRVQAPDVEVCITRTISGAHWAEPGSPSHFDDEIEIQVSQRGMKKYGRHQEQE